MVDPLAGSHYVEWLTDEMEQRALALIGKIDELGGMLKAVEEGFPQRELGDSAFRWQREVESGERLVVGVNAFQVGRGAAHPDPQGGRGGAGRRRSSGSGR